MATEKEIIHHAAIDAISNFKDENGKLISKEDFKSHGIKIVKPIFNDFRRIFLQPTGDFTDITSAYHATLVLNPLKANGISEQEIEVSPLFGSYESLDFTSFSKNS